MCFDEDTEQHGRDVVSYEPDKHNSELSIHQYQQKHGQSKTDFKAVLGFGGNNSTWDRPL